MMEHFSLRNIEEKNINSNYNRMPKSRYGN